ncbi:MAG: hypothetical protein HOP10_02700 [Chitinophagaceae bacterium]|nr:hypothetical protein [Chitinophagaceae bacterium]
MPSIVHTIKIILSDKRTSIAIIALAIVARIIQLFFFYNMNVDGMYQVMAMQNFADGHGVSASMVLPADLSTIVYEPLIKWPPGYSLLLSPFYILFDHNYIIASLVLDILAAVVLIFTCRKILRILDTPLYLTNLFTLLTGFFIYFFYFINSSDAIAVTFFLLAIYFTLLILKKDSFSLKATIAACSCLFLCGLIKYLFIPVVFIIPAFLLLKGVADKSKHIKRAAAISFVFLLITMAGILTWQKITGGSATYISEPTRGFFPGNLNQIHPAIPASFIDTYSISLVIPPGSLVISIIFRSMQVLHFAILFFAFVYLVRRILKNGFKKITTTDSFFYISFFLSVGITVVLVALSLTVGKEENIPGHWWTYVEEPRYYGLVNVLTHLSVFLLYQYYRIHRSKKFRYIIIGLVVLLLPETFHGIHFTVKRIVNVKTEKYSWQKEWEIQDYAELMIKKHKRPGEQVAVTGYSYYINYRVGIYNHVPVLLDAESSKDPSKLNAKKPTLLLIINETKPEEDDLYESRPGYAGSWEGFDFYVFHVQPH